MLLTSTSTNPLLLLTTLLPILTLACNPPPTTNTNTSSYPKFHLGSDPPADAATIGYNINHFSLLVNNITATKHFYGTIIGMRELFTYESSKDMSILYMGHSHGGKNGTGWQTGEELNREKNNSEGLIEFISTTNSTRAYNPTAAQTFSHTGLVVPNITATQERFESFHVPILKRVGEIPEDFGMLPGAFGLLDPAIIPDALKGIIALGFERFLIVADPDGNLIEIQEQA